MNSRSPKRLSGLVCLLVLFFALGNRLATAAPESAKNEKGIQAQELKNLKFGMFICWSFSTFSDQEWTPGVKDVSYFNPSGMDTDQWCRVAKEAGMGYILFLTKHHDGFCLWDTKTTDWKATKSPLGQDVLAAVKKSCDQYGLKLALYFSEGDWTWPGAETPATGSDKFVGGKNAELKKAQLKELLTQYGPIAYIWFDHAQGDGGLDHIETAQFVKSVQPDCFVGFNHGQTAGDLRAGEYGKPGPLDNPEAGGFNKAVSEDYLIAEFAMPILGNQGRWFYTNPGNDAVSRSAEEIFSLYQEAVKYGNLFSLDIGPDRSGKLREIDVKTLREVGKLIREATPLSYSAAVISPLLKLRPEQSYTGPDQRYIHLAAARGEAESSQVRITAQKDISNMAVTTSELTGPGGAVIQPEISLVGYVPVEKPTPGGFGIPGQYPDPLLPLQPFSIKKEEAKSLWVTAWVPQDAPSGDYKGKIQITVEGDRPSHVDVELQVFHVNIPVQSKLCSLFLIWGQGGKEEFYGKKRWEEEMRDPFYEQLLRYRLNASPPTIPWDTVFTKQPGGKWDADWNEFDQQVKYWMGKGTTFFRTGGIIGWPGVNNLAGSDSPEDKATREEWAGKLALLDHHLAEMKWEKMFGIYAFDEPGISPDYPEKGDTTGPENAAKIREFARFVQKHAPHLRILMVTCDPAYEDVKLDVPAYIWVPHINHFHPDFQQRRQAMGEPSWMYVCITTVYVPEFPDIWRIDRSGTSHRAIGWWLSRYHCDGFLYWAVDHWPHDVFANPMAYPGGNGDGFLFYPAPDKISPPYPSVRLEIVRDGFEDYDLFAMLREKIAQIEKDSSRSEAVSKLLPEAKALVQLETCFPSISSFPDDPLLYESRHQKVLRMLESLEP